MSSRASNRSFIKIGKLVRYKKGSFAFVLLLSLFIVCFSLIQAISFLHWVFFNDSGYSSSGRVLKIVEVSERRRRSRRVFQSIYVQTEHDVKNYIGHLSEQQKKELLESNDVLRFEYFPELSGRDYVYKISNKNKVILNFPPPDRYWPIILLFIVFILSFYPIIYYFVCLIILRGESNRKSDKQP